MPLQGKYGGKSHKSAPVNHGSYTSSIVNIASISGVMKGSSSGQFAYASSKAGFLHLGRMLATTLAEAKIRVNTIAPGLFPSEMTAGESDDNQKSELDTKMSNPARWSLKFPPSIDSRGAKPPLERTGNDADMAACILFLAGPGGLFLNNQVLYPDGGRSRLILPMITVISNGDREHLDATCSDVTQAHHDAKVSCFNHEKSCKTQASTSLALPSVLSLV